MKWGDLMVQVVNWGDLMVQDLHGENCIRKIWVPAPFVNIFEDYYSPLMLLYICFQGLDFHGFCTYISRLVSAPLPFL